MPCYRKSGGGKILISGKMVDIDDLPDEVLDERMDILQHYYEELVRCVEAEKKDKIVDGGYNTKK